MNNGIFKISNKKIEFEGDFEKFYKNNNSFNQDLENDHLLEEYIYSRNQIISNLSGLDFHSLADIGCGFGLFTNEIKTNNPNKQIDGYDVSKTAIKIAKSRYNINFFEHDITSKPLSKKYDLILLNQVIYYLQEDERSSFNNLISSTNKYMYFSIFMNDDHKYGKLHFRRGDLFTKYLIEKFNFTVLLSNNKKIYNNNCFEIIFDINQN